MKRVVIAIIALGLVIGSIVGVSAAVKYLKSDDGYEPQEISYSDEEEYDEAGDSSEGTTTKSNAAAEDTSQQTTALTLDYDLPKQLKSQLDMPSFDKEITSYLDEKGYVPHNNEGVPGGLLLKNNGWVQVNYNDGSLMFDLQLQTQQREIVKCVVSNGEYYFEMSEGNANEVQPDENEGGTE